MARGYDRTPGGGSGGGSSVPYFKTMTGAAAPDGFAYQPTTFAGVVDPIWKIGYNAGGQVGGEPQWHIGIEGNYRTGVNDTGIWFQDGASHNTNEMYAEWYSASGAINFRPFYIGVLRDDNVTKAACVYFDVGTSGFPKSQFQIKAGASTMLTVTAGGVDVSTGIPLRVGGVSVLTAAAPIAPFGNIVGPPGFGISQVTSGGTMSALSGRGVRVVVPKNGTLHDIAAYVAASSGNINVAVYDTGDQTGGSGTRTRLYQSGSIACPAAGSWQVLADPNITVTAGQQLDLVITADNATASFARYAMNGGGGGPASTQLPGSLNAVPGNAAPKMCFTYPTLGAIGTYPTTVIEAGVSQQDNPMLLIGRVA